MTCTVNSNVSHPCIELRKQNRAIDRTEGEAKGADMLLCVRVFAYVTAEELRIYSRAFFNFSFKLILQARWI
jgi:hypothetical protein